MINIKNIATWELKNMVKDSKSKILSLQHFCESLQQQINELKHENAVLAAKLYINNGENYDNR